MVHEAVREVTHNSPFQISAEIVSNEDIEKVKVWFQNGNVYEATELEQERAYTYKVLVPKKLMNIGF